MATFPLAHPAIPSFSEITLAPQAAVARSESPFTFEENVFAHPGQRWAISISLRPMKRADAEQWTAFGLLLNGPEKEFLMGDPAGPTPRGVGTGTPLVNGASQTGSSLITDGWTSSQTGIMLAGDYFQLGSGATARLYKVLEDVNSDGGGNATLSIWPALRVSPSNDDPIVVSSPVGRWRLAAPIPWAVNAALIYGIDFSAVESIS